MPEDPSLHQFVRRNPYGAALWFMAVFSVVTRWVV